MRGSYAPYKAKDIGNKGSFHKRQKLQAPIRNRQTRKVANAKVRNRYTNPTNAYLSFCGHELWRLRRWRLRFFGAIECIPKKNCFE